MYKNLRWKLITIAVVTGLAVWAFTPPKDKIHLGLDLKGGVHFVLKVHTDDALRVETETSSEQFREALKTATPPINVTAVKIDSLTEFTVEGVPPADEQRFRQLASDRLG